MTISKFFTNGDDDNKTPSAHDNNNNVKIIENIATMSTTTMSGMTDHDMSDHYDRRDAEEQRHQQHEPMISRILPYDHRDVDVPYASTAVYGADDTCQHHMNGKERYYPQDPTSQRVIAMRKMNIIRNLVPYLERDVQQIQAESTLLRQHRKQIRNDQYPLFHRSEIITGKLLGRGGFSDVYEIAEYQLNDTIHRSLSKSQQLLREKAAYDVRMGQQRYAMKQLQSNLLDKSIREFQFAATDFIIEVMYMSLLNHPNILSIRGLPLHGIRSFLDGHYNSFFMICDRLHETLDDRIHNQWNKKQSCPTNLQKIEYSLQLANALQYLHEKRIVYRDLKPQNIAFAAADDDRIVLFDFGLVRELPKNGTMNHIYEMSGVGTRRYMAPEVVNDSKYNCKADVYSWSMILWEMLTHHRPYEYHTVEQHRITVCQGGERPSINHIDWPKSVQYLLKGCWTECIASRFHMKEVCGILQRLCDNESVQCNTIDDSKNTSRQSVGTETDMNHTSFHSTTTDPLAFSNPLTDYETLFGIPCLTESTSNCTLSLNSSSSSTTSSEVTCDDISRAEEKVKHESNVDCRDDDEPFSMRHLLSKLLLCVKDEDNVEIMINNEHHQHVPQPPQQLIAA